MSKPVRVAFALAAAAGAALLMPACESVPLTAAPGTTMTLTANPEFVIANGGLSVVTAILVEPAGTFVPDGTEIFCFATLGRVDASGKTVNGVARVNFVSDARSGKATVTCISGGQAPAPSASPTAVAGAGPGIEVAASDARTPVAALNVRTTTGENSAFVEISIGNALPDRVLVTASPRVLASARSATIVANVFDQFGNPVQNVPVIFAITAVVPATAPQLEGLDSGGAPRFTDANGQAFDTLTTRAPYSATVSSVQKTVTVTATTATGKDDTVDVVVNYTSVGR